MKVSEQARKSLPIFASALMLSLAFPPANVSLLVLIALAPWLASLRDTDARGAKKSGYLFGFLYFLFQMYWLVPFVGRWTGSYALAAIPWIVCAAIAGLYYMGVGWLTHRCWKLYWPWLIPIVWAGVEGFRSYVVGLAFPWGIVAEPLWLYPAFIQHAAWGTIFLVSASVVLFNLLVAMFVWPSKEHTLAPRVAFRYVSVLVVFIALSVMRHASPQQGTTHVYCVAQMGVDEAFGSELTKRQDVQRAVESIMALAVAGGAQTVVFPEGLADPSKTLPPESPIKPPPGIAVLFGGNHIVDGKAYQTAYAYDGEWKYADKTRLVIFGEFVPLRDQLSFLQKFNLPSGDLEPAKELTTLEVNGVTIGQLLCFEGVFPDLAERHGRNGAQLLAVMAIDDWYAGTPAHEQLTTSSVWRSVESGLPLLRATSMGTSMVTDSRGNRTAVAARFGQTTALRAEVTVPTGSDAFPYRFAFVWVCWLAIGFMYVERYFLSKTA